MKSVQGARADINAEQVMMLVFKQTVQSMPMAYGDLFILSRIGGLTYEEVPPTAGFRSIQSNSVCPGSWLIARRECRIRRRKRRHEPITRP